VLGLILTLAIACPTASQTPTAQSGTDSHELAKKLSNHIWSVAGDDDRARVNSTFLQPFIAYNTKDAWTYTVNMESSYDWVGNNWSVPINFTITKLTKFGRHPVSLGGGLKLLGHSGPGGPENCGLRVVVTPLFPR